jgi:magnesium chelatase family protein
MPRRLSRALQWPLRCSTEQVLRYRARLSRPLLDRIDLQIEVPAVPQEGLALRAGGETTADIRSRVEGARAYQIEPQKKPNAKLATREIDKWCAADEAGQALLKRALTRLGLSARAYHRILKVARTIADLGGAPNISSVHLAEAIQYRRLDRA